MMGGVQAVVKDVIGPKTLFPDDILSTDLFMPGFEIGQHEPYLFSKVLSERNQTKYHMKAHQVTRACMQYPGSFIQSEDADLAFVDPNNYLWSSTNLAYLYTRHMHNISTSNIRLLNLDPGIQYFLDSGHADSI